MTLILGGGSETDKLNDSCKVTVLWGCGKQRSHFFLVVPSSKHSTDLNANHTISMQRHPKKYTVQVKNYTSKPNGH